MINRLSSLLFYVSLTYNQLAFAEENSTKDGMIDVGGFSLYYQCKGQGLPIIFIESGLGVAPSEPDWYALWQPFIERFSQENQVCFYERAGLGKSEKGPVPYTSFDVAERFNRLIQNANIVEPIVLVAHSIGGLHARAFHDLYSQKVAGVLLIDTTPYGSEMWAYKEMSTAHKDDNPDYLLFKQQFLNRFSDPTTNPESMDILKSNQQVDRASNFREQPLAIVQRTFSYNPPPKGLPKDVEQRWDKLYNDSENVFKSMSKNSHFWRSSSKSHFLMTKEEDFDTVEKATVWLLQQVEHK
jgi:pimeloyl-ACP methyl ester carboxylesterase